MTSISYQPLEPYVLERRRTTEGELVLYFVPDDIAAQMPAAGAHQEDTTNPTLKQTNADSGEIRAAHR